MRRIAKKERIQSSFLDIELARISLGVSQDRFDCPALLCACCHSMASVHLSQPCSLCKCLTPSSHIQISCPRTDRLAMSLWDFLISEDVSQGAKRPAEGVSDRPTQAARTEAAVSDTATTEMRERPGPLSWVKTLLDAFEGISGKEKTHKHKQICGIVPGLGGCRKYVCVFFGSFLMGEKNT